LRCRRRLAHPIASSKALEHDARRAWYLLLSQSRPIVQNAQVSELLAE
jgi:hypothetical protein